MVHEINTSTPDEKINCPDYNENIFEIFGSMSLHLIQFARVIDSKLNLNRSQQNSRN